MERGEHLHVVGEVARERALERLASEHHHLARLRRQLLEHLRLRAPARKAKHVRVVGTLCSQNAGRHSADWLSFSAATASLERLEPSGTGSRERIAKRRGRGREKRISGAPYHNGLGEDNAQLDHMRHAQERRHEAPLTPRPVRHLRVAVAVAELVEAPEQLRRHALDLREQLRRAIQRRRAREKDYPRRPLL